MHQSESLGRAGESNCILGVVAFGGSDCGCVESNDFADIPALRAEQYKPDA
jgi:hypothetical protein